MYIYYNMYHWKAYPQIILPRPLSLIKDTLVAFTSYECVKTNTVDLVQSATHASDV